MLILGSLLIGSWLFFRYFKLRQVNLKLEMNRKELQRQNELDKLENESREKILNATIDGKESERKMIAETLHHSVSSLLSSANLHLQASKMQMKDLTPEEIFKAQKIINEAAEKIRNLSHSLVSSVLLKFGLKYAIQDMCEKYSNSALSFTCECGDIPRFAPSFELKINSIVDELLNNIIKHSHATESNIAIDSYNNRLNISIIDNGTGFKINQNAKSNGLGLTQIEARIKKMDGVFKIDSSPKTGTKVFISVPVVHKDEEKEVTNFFKN
jgi:signal transduction histidine kinase